MDNEKLIELVWKCSFLYDLQDKRYSDAQKQDTAWIEIAKKLLSFCLPFIKHFMDGKALTFTFLTILNILFFF
jgi:phage-related holin